MGGYLPVDVRAGKLDELTGALRYPHAGKHTSARSHGDRSPVPEMEQSQRHVDTAETGKIDVEDEQIRPVSRDRVEDESTVVDRRCLDGKMFLERRLDRRGRIRIVLSDEDALHTTSRKARARRKIRSLVQSLQRHMSLDDATTVPAVVRPLP